MLTLFSSRICVSQISPFRPTMTSIDSKADFSALLTELGIHEELAKWLKASGFETISDLAFTFVATSDGAALINQVPEPTWTAAGIDASVVEVTTTVMAGKLRRLLAQCRLLAQQMATPDATPVTSTAASPLASPSWSELAPPRLTPEAVASMSETFLKNYPGELLNSESTPSIRLLSMVHHFLKPGQSIKYIPWQLRMSQKQYQEMTEAKTHKAIRSEAQLLGALLDETPEIPMESMKLSAEWLRRTQQVFRNAFVMCNAAHLQIFKKFDEKFFSLALKRHPGESSLRSVNLAEMLEADKVLWNEITSMLGQKWTLNDALHELTAARADMYGLLQPRPRVSVPAPKVNPSPKKSGKVKQTQWKGQGERVNNRPQQDRTPTQDLCTYIMVDGNKQAICQRFQKGSCSSKTCKYAHVCAVKIKGKPCGMKHGANNHGSRT